MSRPRIAEVYTYKLFNPSCEKCCVETTRIYIVTSSTNTYHDYCRDCAEDIPFGDHYILLEDNIYLVEVYDLDWMEYMLQLGCNWYQKMADLIGFKSIRQMHKI